MNKRMIMLTFLLAAFATLAMSSFTSAKKPAPGETCVETGPFLILENQRYALCATASCFTYNQVLYCGCDILKGDSISLPLEFDSQNICDINEQGKTNGYMVSTFSLPEDTVYPDGNLALYTCPGENSFAGSDFVAIGSYGQCDGGICFTSTKGKTFPGFDERLKKEIICACPISTTCDPTSRNPQGYQIAGGYDSSVSENGVEGGCNPEDCEMCSAGEIEASKCSDNKNPLADIAQGTIIPVGAPTGSPEDLACLLLEGNVPQTNSCLCRCLVASPDGKCKEWTVIDQSPLEANCEG